MTSDFSSLACWPKQGGADAAQNGHFGLIAEVANKRVLSAYSDKSPALFACFHNLLTVRSNTSQSEYDDKEVLQLRKDLTTATMVNLSMEALSIKYSARIQYQILH